MLEFVLSEFDTIYLIQTHKKCNKTTRNVMPVSFKAAQSLTILTPFLILKELLTHWFSLFTLDHSVTVAQSFNAFLSMQ